MIDTRGRAAFVELVQARIGEWQKAITTLEQKLAKKDDSEARERLAQIKAKAPLLAEKAAAAPSVPSERWSDFKSETDLLLESLDWLNKSALRRLAG